MCTRGTSCGRSATCGCPSEQRVQFLLRLHISHLLQTCSRLTPHHDAGVPARGLNGEAYRGHVFWDELYVYPFLNFRLPEITRGLLMYRYRRIGEARASAQTAGFRGAMYPWQSGSDGEEETQLIHINPLVGQVGAGPQLATSATSTRRSSTTSGTTTRPPTTSISCATTARR